jgi:PAS domain S-box-containing protein
LRERHTLISRPISFKSIRGEILQVHCNLQRDPINGEISFAAIPRASLPLRLSARQTESLHPKQKLFVEILLNTSFRVIAWDSAAEQLFGVTATDAMERHINELFVDSDWPQSLDPGSRQAMLSSHSFRFTGTCDPGSGELLHMEWYVDPVTDTAGNLESWRFLGLDITRFEDRLMRLDEAREEVEQDLEEYKEKLLFSLQMVKSASWEWNLIDKSVTHSENWAPSLGFEQTEDLTDADFWMSIVKQEDQQRVIDAVVAHLNGVKKMYEADFRVINAHGEERWVRGWGKIIEWDEQGKAVRLMGIHADITEFKHSEQFVAELQAQLFQARKMHSIGQLTGGFAHDFNNILASILGYTTLVLEKGEHSLQSRFKDYLTEVFRAAKLGQSMVAQMLRFARSGSTEMTPAMISLLTRDAVQLMRPSMPSSIELNLAIDDHLPSVETNAFKLSQMLMNLCVNAKDAMKGIGTLEIGLNLQQLNRQTCSACGASIDGQFVQLQVEDSGSGLSKHMLPHVFDPFFTTKEAGEGTGMGLSIVNNLIHEHNGHLQVDSEMGKGTIFKLLFPPSRKISATQPVIHLGTSRYKARNRGHILVVDDDTSVGTYIAEVLRHHGHRVTARFDSLEALDLFKENPNTFDLIVTDQVMPGVTGFDLMSETKRVKADIPVIICSAYSEDMSSKKAVDAGADGYLKKPIDVDRLLQLIDESLVRKKKTAL